MIPKSPLNNKNKVSLSDTFLSQDIIMLYQQQLDIDVSSFFKEKNKIHLYKDEDTDYRFYHPAELAGDGKFYEELQKKLGSEYYHEWKFENQLAYDEIKPGDKVLDIGCGIGNFLMRAKEKTSTAVGLELNENAVSECRKKGLHVFNEMIQQHAQTHEGFYDVVCIFQVLEHIYDVKGFLESSLKVLRKGGKIVIGVPNSEPYFLGYDKYCTLNLPPHHMGLWHKKTFLELAKHFNLNILDIKYDIKGRVIAEAYTRAKYIAGVKSSAGKHSREEKIKISMAALLTLPLTFIKKITKGLNGTHIAVLFEKK